MQDIFVGTLKGKKKLIKECQNLILASIKKEEEILILEYSGHEETLEEIVNTLSGYSKVEVLKKSTDDGSKKVHSLIKKKNMSVGKIKVCGVSLTACVKATSESLADMGYQIQIFEKATNGDTYGFGKDFLPDHENIEMVK